jgi:hypothetical protein
MTDQQLIDKYVQGRLSTAEELVFNERLKSHPDFKAQLEFAVNLQRVAEAEDAHLFKQQLRAYDRSGRTNLRYTKWLVAASVAILVALGYYTIFRESPAEQLFAQNFEPYRNIVQPIERGSTLKDQKSLAFAAYEKADYETAERYFEVLKDSEESSNISFYLANTKLALDKPSAAIPLLKTHIEASDSFSDKAKWYLALAWLQMNKPDEAKSILEAIVEDQSYNADKARQLLDKL